MGLKATGKKISYFNLPRCREPRLKEYLLMIMRPIRFYYADERTPEGKSVAQEVNGEAHAEHYFKLANGEVPIEWHQTFVKGKGYVKF